jgi:hypothetical protein
LTRFLHSVRPTECPTLAIAFSQTRIQSASVRSAGKGLTFEARPYGGSSKGAGER